MWSMFTNSLRLFLKGKLFRDPHAVLTRWSIGFGAALLGVIVLGVIGLPTWFAVLVPALGAGLAQPYLFRDLKYD